MIDKIMLVLLFISLIGIVVAFLWAYIKIHEVYGVPHFLVDLKNWVKKYGKR